MCEKDFVGAIYILSNPSFPDYVKIGYADDVEKRVKELNRSECIPFAFRLRAYYKVKNRLTDMKLHEMIDKLNSNLRSIDYFGGKKRVREFYAMSWEDAFGILEAIAEINGSKENLVLVEQSSDEIKEEESAEEIRTKRPYTSLPKMNWLIEQGVVHVGDVLYVINHPDETAVVVEGDTVNYKGNEMSLNQFGCKVTGWKAIQSYTMMKIKGKNETLAELRDNKLRELEKSEEK